VNFSIIFSVRSYLCLKSELIPIPIYFPDSEGPVKLELPEQWLWDIIDEFIYQFQVFCTWRSKVKNKTEDELLMLADGAGVRSLNILLLVMN